MIKKANLTGLVFGRLTVLIEVHNPNSRARKWLCQCRCGGRTISYQGSLVAGRTTSCGCYRNELRVKHSMSRTRIYSIWSGMLNRCYSKGNTRYKDYGGRGIAVCKKWHSFDNFYTDMIETYADDLSLERKRNNRPYSKFNCKWATRKEQMNNTRASRFITFKGETFTLTQWANKQGLKPITLHYRIKRGWSLAEALLGKK